jgi:hypothetical protein
MKEKQEKTVLRKMSDMETGGIADTTIFPQKTFFENFTDYIRENSLMLKDAIICQGLPSSWGFVNMEPFGDTITLLGNETLKPAISVYKRQEFIPQALGVEITLPHRADDPDEIAENKIVENAVYAPLLKAVERQCISGNYFHKSIFNTTNITNTISGTNFNGLLSLARGIKHKTDDGCIVINPVILESILDSTMPPEYKQEFLFNHTIEGVSVLSTMEAPTKNAAAFDRKKIVLSICDGLSIKKFSVAGNINYFYHIFCLANFADLFNTAIVLEM